MEQLTQLEVPEHREHNGAGIDAAETVNALGVRIRELRNAHGLTLQALSNLTGLTASMLSMVERGRTSPSIGSLIAIASALHVHMSELFDVPTEVPPRPVHRVEDQPVFETATGMTRRLALSDDSRGLELVSNVFEPGSVSSATPVHHEGFEYGVVLEGELTVELEGERFLLQPGDSISYESTRPHLISNNGKVPVRAIWVNLDR
ncbi:MAG: cupin domain-containing protein [Actinomycetota bacterium]|nr:cupin domain-containing protein [Actinomycetota bacterium]